MYINLQTKSKIWCLVMVPIKVLFTAEVCVKALRGNLDKLGISLSQDIVGLVTDSHTVMVKVGLLVNTEHQLCFDHGIHLAVCDVLYKKKFVEDKEEKRAIEENTAASSTSTKSDEDNSETEEILEG